MGSQRLRSSSRIDWISRSACQGRDRKAVNPSELYNRLDRASNKGPLRPAQHAVLEEWHANRRGDKDVILKLQTGQGKAIDADQAAPLFGSGFLDREPMDPDISGSHSPVGVDSAVG